VCLLPSYPREAGKRRLTKGEGGKKTLKILSFRERNKRREVQARSPDRPYPWPRISLRPSPKGLEKGGENRDAAVAPAARRVKASKAQPPYKRGKKRKKEDQSRARPKPSGPAILLIRAIAKEKEKKKRRETVLRSLAGSPAVNPQAMGG